ncbi:hypothetical protein CDL12_14767 [Handroanthus impetiginosus]|uniref:TCP domain-containing protein n=1 Tax=Handroanthus impetiginosus TaxID=429701 RepID=A0A2G9H524_9LAMI|nr:hypothetical protein CDL12_14767 [Handroanthus impetiginosus]
MTMDPKQKDIGSKKELDQDPNYKKTLPKISPSSSSSSRQWSSSYKNPRIVRVSRAFGGKDRHSKVCTVRGLRDRRIRLSVPTAIQLYDLQDRLGLNQPSKVVDWLIDVTKNDIDKLPPLPMLPSNFTQIFHPSSQDHFGAAKINNHQQENQEGFGGFLGQLSSQNLFPTNNQTPFPNFVYSNPNFFPWDPSNLSLSQFGVGFSENHQPSDNLPTLFPYLCPSSTNIPSYITPSMDNDLRQVNQSPLLPTTLHLISPPTKSFMNPKNVHASQEKDTQEKDKFLKIPR